MRRTIHRQLDDLERTEAAALRARVLLNGPSGAKVFRELLSSCDFDPLPGASLAETISRAAEINARELKDLLWERAQAIAL
jgi:hypothetical protein